MIDMQAEIYTSSGQFLYVKLILDGSVYISGIKVSISKKFPDQVWIQMPSYKSGKAWKRYIEFAGNSRLGQAMYRTIEETCRPRLFGEDASVTGGSVAHTDVVIEDFDENAPINLDDIPF